MMVDNSNTSSAPLLSRIHAVQRQRSAEVQPASHGVDLSVERKRIADRLVDALIAMTPEACEHMLSMAEVMASKHPAAARMYLVHAGLSATRVNETGGAR